MQGKRPGLQRRSLGLAQPGPLVGNISSPVLADVGALAWVPGRPKSRNDQSTLDWMAEAHVRAWCLDEQEALKTCLSIYLLWFLWGHPDSSQSATLGKCAQMPHVLPSFSTRRTWV